MEVAGRSLIDRRQRLCATIKCAQAVLDPALVGDGDNACEHRRRQAGAAQLHPRSGGAIVVGVVDGDAAVGIGVHGHVRDAALAGALEGVLVGGLRLLTAETAATAAPGGLAEIVARGVNREGRAADGDHVGGVRRIAARRPAVAGGGDEAHARVARGRREIAVEVPLATELTTTEAHGNGGDIGVIAGGVDGGGDQVVVAAGVGLVEDDVGLGGDRMRPFDVERFL